MSSGRDRKRQQDSSSSSNLPPTKCPHVDCPVHESSNENALSIHDEERSSSSCSSMHNMETVESERRVVISPLARFPTPASQVVVLRRDTL